MPDPQRDFIVEIDGSRLALGAVLKQKFDDTGVEHPVGFYIGSLTGSERNYVAYEWEMYAVVRAIEHFRRFLLGKEILLPPITQHSAIYFEEIYPQQLELNDGSYDFQSILFGSSIKEDKIMSSQT